MSAYTEELPREVAVSWRKFLGTAHGQFGIDWLRQNGPRAGGKTATEVVESAFTWTGYQTALNDLEDRLTALPVQVKSLDEPPLETPEPRT